MGSRAFRRVGVGICLVLLALWLTMPRLATGAEPPERLLLPLLLGLGPRPTASTPTAVPMPTLKPAEATRTPSLPSPTATTMPGAPTATVAPSATVSPTRTACPSVTPTPSATATTPVTPTPSATASPTPTVTPTATVPAALDGRISYVSLTWFWQSLAVRSADGVDVEYPTDLLSFSDRPTWSPDGAWLAYSGSPYFSGEGHCDWGMICVMDPTARVQWPLTPEGVRGERPTWSPDGGMVAFMVAGADGWDIAVAAADGAWMETVVASSGNDLHPTWSPDSRRLAYLSDRQGPGGHYGDVDLYVVDLDSGEDRLVLDLGTNIDGPRWSPADERIAFVASVGGAYDVLTVNVDGTNLHNLTDHAAADHSPAWSPDGAHIAWISDRDGQDDVYVMDADGSDSRNVSDRPDPDEDPAWSPDGQWLAYVAFEALSVRPTDRVPRVRVVRADGHDNHLFADGANPHWGRPPDPEAPPPPIVSDRPAPVPRGSPAPLPTAHASGWLAYSVPQGEDEWGVHLRDLASSDALLLAELEGRWPVLAFDGARAAIGMDQEYPGLWELYLVGIDGDAPERIMLGEQPDLSLHRLDWSPDGGLLAVSEGLLDYQHAVHVLDPAAPPDILEDVRVTPAWEFYSAGAWWPDGSRLVLSHIPLGPGVWAGSIITVHPDGTEYTLLLPRATDEWWPVPSPDGSRVAFESDALGDSDIYVMDADGRNLENLTHHPAWDAYPVWSPDGEEIAFRSSRAGDEAIYVLNADGTDLRRLTAEDTGRGSFSWVEAATPTLPAPGVAE